MTHLIGIGGIGMSGIAQLLLARGEGVSGSDLTPNPILQRIRSLGGEVRLGHAARNVNGPDRVIYSSSISPQNPELIAARNRGIPVVHRGQMMAELIQERRTIAVTGAHGKSTTTAMAAQLLMQAGLDPTVVLGAEVESIGGNVRAGNGPYAVVEADESDGSLLWLKPQVGIITNIDEEHLDYYRNSLEILQAFSLFADRVLEGGSLIGCADDPSVRRILFTPRRSRVISYGLGSQAIVTAAQIECDAGESRYQSLLAGKKVGRIRLRIPGIHNVVNSLGVVALADSLGIPFRVARAALEGYSGAKRRFQIQAQVDGILVVEDYGHHPTEIQATLQAARSWAGRRIRCVFQPHRYSRTRFLMNRFGSCFQLADEVILLPIYAASEDPIEGVSSETLIKAIQATGKKGVFLESAEKVLDRLASDSKSGDMILFLGAGDVGKLSERLVERLKA